MYAGINGQARPIISDNPIGMLIANFSRNSITLGLSKGLEKTNP